MITQTSLILAAAFTALTSISAGTAVEKDPVPNKYDPATFEPLAGGIGYTWTVGLGQIDEAKITGVVGAWSWDEDGTTGTEKGWTHTSNWVALSLSKPSNLTIRLQRNAEVVDPFAEVVGTKAGGKLFPALTVYSNWDGDGGDFHTYNNGGKISWAEDVTYLAHQEFAEGGKVAVLKMDLPAGRYSVAFGGNSPSTLAQGRQGYLATFTSALHGDHIPSILWEGSKQITTRENSRVLAGTIANYIEGTKVKLTVNGRNRTAELKGKKWSAPVRLSLGRNIVEVRAYAPDGHVSKPLKLVITRK